MNDDQLLRYSRHILLDTIGIEGQQALINSHVLIIGAGGLGAPAALYLAAGGVGTLTLADGDVVDLTNLQRQIIHSTARIGQNKAQSAATALMALNPDTRVILYPQRLTGEALHTAVQSADVVLDCSDNYTTRHAINRACIAARKPLVSGAALSFSGQLAVFDSRLTTSPCYHCLFPEAGDAGGQNCATFGVFSPLVGIIGTLQAAEAMKLLMQIGTPLTGKLQLFDALSTEWRTLQVPRDPQCAACGTPLTL